MKNRENDVLAVEWLKPPGKRLGSVDSDRHPEDGGGFSIAGRFEGAKIAKPYGLELVKVALIDYK